MEAVAREIIQYLYGRNADIQTDLVRILTRYQADIAALNRPECSGYSCFTEHSAFLIAYADHIRGEGASPLQYLHRFYASYLQDLVSGIHILPFFPYTSDEGYSISNYRIVNPSAGTWEEIRAIAGSCQLMADLVINHCSTQHPWFQSFLAGEKPYTDYFITADPQHNFSEVARPRTGPLLHAFETAGGTRHVWTTFSADQVDLNFACPAVLLEFVDIMLFYVSQGVQVIRLDAIAYLWKETGTPCIHLPQTHAVVQLLRSLLRTAAPWATLITETNVAHQENISYFGDGKEADMVYQFSLPPLVLDASIREDTRHLQQWAQDLPEPADDRGFFNFLASHDGIGLLPAQGFLSKSEMDNLIQTVKARGGKVSYKATTEGKIPYELNINYLSATSAADLPAHTRAAKFMVCQATLLAMAGVPGIYLHSLVGSENWAAGIDISNRSVNRQRLEYEELCKELEDSNSLRYHVFFRYMQLLSARTLSPAFHPSARQRILQSPVSLFVILRTAVSPDGDEKSVLCIHNFSGNPAEYTIKGSTVYKDLLTNEIIRPYRSQGVSSFYLEPYQVLWLCSYSDEHHNELEKPLI